MASSIVSMTTAVGVRPTAGMGCGVVEDLGVTAAVAAGGIVRCIRRGVAWCGVCADCRRFTTSGGAFPLPSP